MCSIGLRGTGLLPPSASRYVSPTAGHSLSPRAAPRHRLLFISPAHQSEPAAAEGFLGHFLGVSLSPSVTCVSRFV